MCGSVYLYIFYIRLSAPKTFSALPNVSVFSTRDKGTGLPGVRIYPYMYGHLTFPKNYTDFVWILISVGIYTDFLCRCTDENGFS